MVNNGKFANGGMIMNPFASVNDGLMDITWISDPSWQGTMGVTDIMSQARGKGGIQAYQDHSTYKRARKIRIDIPQPNLEQPELNLEQDPEPKQTPEGEGAAQETPTPAADERPKQVIVIDGEPLQYSSSISYELLPGNVEIIFDDSQFFQRGVFTKRLSEASEQDRVVREVVDKIWKEFDVDDSGELDRDETRRFLS